MISTNINNIYPRPSMGSTSAVLAQKTLTISSGSTTGFTLTTFDKTSTLVFFDVQASDVVVTFDNSTPAVASSGNLLPVGTNYTWSRGTMAVARFRSATSTNAFISAQEFQV